MSNIDDAMANYFGKNSVVIEKEPLKRPQTDYTHQHEQDGTHPERTGQIVGSRRDGFIAQGSISTIEKMMEYVDKILKSAWGSSWGTFASANSVNIELEEITLPLIVYDTNTRVPMEGTNPKGTMFNTIEEIVDGKPTGDMIQINKIFYDTVVEFAIYGNTSKEAAELMDKFEDLIRTFTYLLKQKGLSELVFMKEQPSDESSKYTPDIPMKSLMYYVRLEKTVQVKTSMLRRIELELEME